MTSTLCAAPRCPYNALNGFLCRNCTDLLTHDLQAIPWLLDELEVTLSRQDKLAESSDRSSDEQPLPLNMRAVEVRIDLNAVLAAWALHTAGRFGGLDRTVVWTELRLSQYLLAHVDDMLTDPAAGQIADEINDIRRRAERAIDKPVPMVYVGPCDLCDKDLYARPSAAEVQCKNPDCEEIYPIEARRRWLLGKAEDQLLPATEMSRALSGLLQKPITGSMLRGYAHRGRITAHPPIKKDGPPLYRVGEVRDVLLEELAGQPAALAS